MNKLLTQKNVLVISVVGVVLFFVFIFSNEMGFCAPYQLSCMKRFDFMAEIIQIFIPVLFCSLIAYKMHANVFKSWINFTKWWVSLTIILSVLAGFGEQPSYMPAMITPGTVSFLMSSLFLVISLILIVYRFFTLKKGGVGE